MLYLNSRERSRATVVIIVVARQALYEILNTVFAPCSVDIPLKPFARFDSQHDFDSHAITVRHVFGQCFTYIV